ncbi:hypothetical protein [Fibrella arboris]|uniref:hypothetical protein n=1 Tax=Fibrella arboris TaxID=3242486 RepID=UPI003522C417
MMLFIIALEVICVGVGVFYYTNLSPSSLRPLLIYLCLALLIDGLLEVVPDPTGIWTRGQYDLMLPAEFAIYINLFKPKPPRIFRSVAIGLFGLGLYQLTVHLQDRASSTNLYLVMCLLLLPVILLYLWSLATSDKLLTISREPLFWIAISLLFSCTGSAIVTGFYFLLSDRFKAAGKNLFYINYVLTAIRYCMFTVAFTVAGRTGDGR